MVDLLHFRAVLQEVYYFQRILYVALHSEREGFQSLQKEESIERTDGGSGIAQQNGAYSGDIGRRTCHIGKAKSMITRVWTCQLGEFTGSLPVEIAGLYNDTS